MLMCDSLSYDLHLHLLQTHSYKVTSSSLSKQFWVKLILQMPNSGNLAVVRLGQSHTINMTFYENPLLTRVKEGVRNCTPFKRLSSTNIDVPEST